MRSVKKFNAWDATVGDLKRWWVADRVRTFLMNQQQVVGIIGLHEVIARQLQTSLLCNVSAGRPMEVGRTIKSAFYRLRNNPAMWQRWWMPGNLVGTIQLLMILRDIANDDRHILWIASGGMIYSWPVTISCSMFTVAVCGCMGSFSFCLCDRVRPWNFCQ